MVKYSVAVAVVLALLVIVTPSTALADSMGCPAEPMPGSPMIMCGTDYLHTIAGAFDVIPGLGTVTFAGLSFGPGDTDTKIQRQADAVLNVAGLDTIPIELVALQLVSTNLATPIYISRDPTQTSSGTMTIDGTLAGGTFSSFLNVFFDVCTAPGLKGVGCGGTLLGTGSISLAGSGTWAPDPTASTVIVNGVDDGTLGDQLANLHTHLPGDPFGEGTYERDFFPTFNGPECDPRDPNQCHPTSSSGTVPEPGTLTLLAAGLLGIAGLRRRRVR